MRYPVIPRLCFLEINLIRLTYFALYVYVFNVRKEQILSTRLYIFCFSEGIKHEFSTSITRHNYIIERKNCTLQKIAKVIMLYANEMSLIVFKSRQ